MNSQQWICMKSQWIASPSCPKKGKKANLPGARAREERNKRSALRGGVSLLITASLFRNMGKSGHHQKAIIVSITQVRSIYLTCSHTYDNIYELDIVTQVRYISSFLFRIVKGWSTQQWKKKDQLNSPKQPYVNWFTACIETLIW